MLQQHPPKLDRDLRKGFELNDDANGLNDEDFKIAPCLRDGEISHDAASLVTEARTLGSAAWASVLRAWCVPSLFQSLEHILASGEEPYRAINNSLRTLTEMLHAAAHQRPRRVG